MKNHIVPIDYPIVTLTFLSARLRSMSPRSLTKSLQRIAWNDLGPTKKWAWVWGMLQSRR